MMLPKASEFVERFPSPLYRVPGTGWVIRMYHNALDVYWEDGRLDLRMTFELNQEFAGFYFTEKTFAEIEKWLQKKWVESGEVKGVKNGRERTTS